MNTKIKDDDLSKIADEIEKEFEQINPPSTLKEDSEVLTKEESDRQFEAILRAQGYTDQKEIDGIIADGATPDTAALDLFQNRREVFRWIEDGIWEIQGLRKKHFLVKVSKMTPDRKRVYRQKRVDSITTARAVRKQLIALVEDVIKNPEPILFEDLVEEYLDEKSTIWAPSTLQRTRDVLKCYYLKRFGTCPINKIHSDEIRQHFLTIARTQNVQQMKIKKISR